MFRTSTLIAVLALISCQSKKDPDQLKKQLQDLLRKTEGTFAIAFKDLHGGPQLFLNEHERIHAASTMKVPVMVEVYRQAEEGIFKLTDSLTVRNEFHSIVDGSPYVLNPSDDSEFELYKQTGKKKTIDSLLYPMIVASSNLATNILIELVGARNVTATMRSLGIQDMEVLRGVEDQKAFDAGLINTTTAYDFMTVLEKIARGQAVNKDASQRMIRTMLGQKFNTIIPAKLPEGVRVAHKTGWLRGHQHDGGIVMLPDGRSYVLVLLSKGLKNEKEAVESMATASRMIFDYYYAE